MSRLFCDFLICQALVSGLEVDDSAVGKAVLEDTVLHYAVVLMGVYADDRVLLKAPVHDGLENAVHFRIAADSMDHVIGLVIQPGATFYVTVRGLR